jgi:hypothetical protein
MRECNLGLTGWGGSNHIERISTLNSTIFVSMEKDYTDKNTVNFLPSECGGTVAHAVTLPRKINARKEPGRGARGQVCIGGRGPSGPRRHPGRKTDHRSNQPIVQQAGDPAQARSQQAGRD